MKKTIRTALLFTLCFTIFFGIKKISSSKSNYKKISSEKYSSAQIEGFEKSIFGSTGWATINLNLKSEPNENSTSIRTVEYGYPFLILGVSGNYWEIMYGGNHGYVLHDYCMINLPDVVPSIKYNITNAYSAAYRTRTHSGNVIDIPNVTGQVFYGTNCSDGICQKLGNDKIADGKIYNSKIGRNEFIVPSLYSTSKMIAKGEALVQAKNKHLMIYDSFRPVSVSRKVSSEFAPLINNNTANIGSWNKTWFIATITPGVNASAHNYGAAIDVSLWDNTTNSEVTGLPTAMHELSVAATRCTDSSCSQLSSGLGFDDNNNPKPARVLSNIMTSENVGMTPLASEWWHFQDQAGYNRMKNATNINPNDFQVTGIYSDYGFTGNLTTIGDVDGDGPFSYKDALLVYKFYNFLKTKTCETCGDLKNYSDMNRNGQVDMNDVFLILNPNITSRHSGFKKDNSYVYIGSETTINTSIIDVQQYPGTGFPTIDTSISNNKFQMKIDNEVVREYDVVNVYGLDRSYLNGDYILSSDVSSLKCTNCNIVNENNKIYIKYGNDVLKTYDIVSYSYTGHDLSKPYIFANKNVNQVSTDIQNNTFRCTGCVVSLDSSNNKVNIKRSSTSDNNIKSFDLVYYTSKYNLDSTSISISESTVSDLLNQFNCVNCTVSVYNGSNAITSGNIPSGSSIVLKENISSSKEQLKSSSINLNNVVVNVTGVTLNNSSLNLNVGTNATLVANVSPSNASNKNVTWESNNTNVATVNNGVVTSVGVGNATITVKTADGNHTATCNVTVTNPIKYTATYKWNNGTEEKTKTEEFLPGENVIKGFAELIYVPSKKFAGWKYNGRTYDLSSTLPMPESNIELIAEFVDIISNNDKYKIETNGGNKYITGINPKTKISDLNNLGLESDYKIKVFNKDGQTLKTSDNVGTGDIIKVYVNDQQEEETVVDTYTVVVKGDINGDGLIELNDLLLVRSYILENPSIRQMFTNSQHLLIAGDYRNDSGIEINDFFMMRDYYLKN